MNGIQENLKCECVLNAIVRTGTEKGKRKGNQCFFQNQTCFIKIDSKTHGVVYAMIDLVDYKRIKNHTWGITKHGYIVTCDTQREFFPDRTSREAKLAHVIMNCNPNGDRNITVDHKDRNKLNNRKENLRVCSDLENKQNKGKYRNNKSGYKGVSWSTREKRWLVVVDAYGKDFYVGRFLDKEKAAEAYNKKRKELFK